ncbi:ATP-grasp domain-containing protein [Stutzerimonas nitrititolerans]|uniref:ATP-grasp domain-containing protein n=1 Tax=Stutzerimonas nitrititolerans TaxID=2482751 RepID=UPI00289B3066|nr:ATP-grasp domain-containing protein [Stutzerimonas nitrititolerans]
MDINKTILICGNGRSGESLEQIRKWGYKTCLISEFNDDRGLENVDAFVKANTLDPAQALAAARGLSQQGWVFDGIISLCWDCPISVATIAAEYGLRAISVEVATAATHKDKRIAILREAGVQVPCSDLFVGHEKSIAQFPLPAVTKPLDLSGSVGVHLARNYEELLAAVRKTAEFLALSGRKDTIQLEAYVSGTEYSVEGLVANGAFHLTGLSERVFLPEYLPRFVERGDIIPTDIGLETIARIQKLCLQSIEALRIDMGAVKFDLKIDEDDNIFVFEVTPRLGGPRFGTEMVPLANGTCILRALIAQACGQPISLSDLTPSKNEAVVAFNVFPSRSGRVTSVEGLTAALRQVGVYDFKWAKAGGLKPGDRVSLGHSYGYYIVCGKTRTEALERATLFETNLRIEVA